jgi:uncharacterized repeat protein (TIGR03847 family)
VIDLGPAEKFRADAQGEPGERIFYLHATVDGEEFFFVVEKQQVAALGELSLQFLIETNVAADMEAVHRLSATLSEPLALGEPHFRVGGLRIALQESEMVQLELESVDTDDEEVTFTLAPEQLRAAAQHALYVVNNGRPICGSCGLVKEPDGHFCPKDHGHLN